MSNQPQEPQAGQQKPRPMCIKMVLSLGLDDILHSVRKCGIDIQQWTDTKVFQPSYNIYPERVTPVVLQFRGVKVLQSMRWGIPHWRNADQHIFYARTESVKSSRNYNYWKDLRHIRRCVIPCTGDQEKPLVFLAGLYNVRKSNGRETYTFALVTQTGVPLKSAEKGSTQPVVLSCEEISIWLNTSERWDGPLSVLLSDRAELGSGLHSVQVGKRITTSRSNTPSMIIPDVDRLDGIKASIGNILARDPLEPSTPARPPAMVALRMPSTLVSTAKEFSVPKRKRSKRKHPAPKPDTATDAGASSEDSLRSQKSRKHARVE